MSMETAEIAIAIITVVGFVLGYLIDKRDK